MADQDNRPTEQKAKEIDRRVEELERQATDHSTELQQMFAHRAERLRKRRQELDQQLNQLEKARKDTISELQSDVDRIWNEIKEEMEGLETLFRETRNS